MTDPFDFTRTDYLGLAAQLDAAGTRRPSRPPRPGVLAAELAAELRAERVLLVGDEGGEGVLALREASDALRLPATDATHLVGTATGLVTLSGEVLIGSFAHALGGAPVAFAAGERDAIDAIAARIPRHDLPAAALRRASAGLTMARSSSDARERLRRNALHARTALLDWEFALDDSCGHLVTVRLGDAAVARLLQLDCVGAGVRISSIRHCGDEAHSADLLLRVGAVQEPEHIDRAVRVLTIARARLSGSPVEEIAEAPVLSRW